MRLMKFVVCLAITGIVMTWFAVAADPKPLPTGTVEGTVTFKADPKKPWRYARFYLKTRGSNVLAESVVALQGRELRLVDADRKPKTHEVDQRDFMFIPETTALRTGDSVKFLNNDGPTHNVRATHAIANFNENMPSGGEYQHQFKKPTGIQDPITLGCVYHGNMRAFLYVFEHPFFQVTEQSGKFRFENVPAGSFRLDVVHPAGQMNSSQRVEVKPGETLKVEVQLSQEPPAQ